MSKISRNTRRKADVNPGSPLLNVIAMLVVIIMLGLAGYALMAKAFIFEVRKVQNELVHEKARQLSEDISVSIQANMGLSISPQTLGADTQLALTRQIVQNDDIVLIMSENDAGIIDLFLLGNQQPFNQAIVSQGIAQTFDASSLQEYIAQNFPSLILVKFTISSGSFANRQFYVWFENEVQETIEKAASDFYSKLVMAIVSVELIAILIYLVFKRSSWLTKA